MIRALFHATALPNASAPYNTLHLKVYYPAMPTNSDTERMSGVIAADKTSAPMPVVIFFNGINVGIESYHWLAVELAEANIVAVMYTHIAETLPGVIGLTPAIDLSSLPVKQQIIEAAISGNLGRVEALVTSDATLANVCNADCKTPLHFAAAHGHNAIVTYLLENGADPLAVDSDGNRPQATAIDWGHLDTAKILGEFSTVEP